MKSPKCFISYSWESDSHKEWVRSLAEKLQENGVYTFLDQWDVSLGTDLPQFMETSIRESDFVLLICTKAFAEKANSGKGGVGYEKSIVTGEIFTKSVSTTKYVAIIRSGGADVAIPSYLKSKAYLDFRNDETYDHNFEELLRHLYKTPKFSRPPIGKKPNFSNKLEQVEKNRNDTISTLQAQPNNFSSFEVRYKFAFNSMNKSAYDSEVWAKQNSTLDFNNFKERFDFAFNSMNKSAYDAEVWAKQNL